ncbi:hypothetical protein PQ455_15310 [Sphingomonas naphthae]|uniref:Uncharacterized protein n=1 Tax=Sphingomonas naphthae TaxID=1813468 RepID=A0ABY7TIY0_9SPHN|nr:hypothetical protein [Sphingomonas naphthae]WCT72988.1 hypothetical protein PQ455_15310 [Sphingomonas naphthae]
MALPPLSRPSTVIADLKQFFAGEHRHKLLVAAGAILMPALIVVMFIKDGNSGILSTRRTITYIQSWPATRTDAEIIAQQKIDQKIREQQQAEKRAAYQRLAKRLGI